MASFKQYELQDGTKLWKTDVYLGIDPQTGKPKHTVRRGFKTKKEASLVASRIELEVSQGNLEKENNILFSAVYADVYDISVRARRGRAYLDNSAGQQKGVPRTLKVRALK